MGKIKYINAIPYLQELYAEQNSEQESVLEELDLIEDKIPADLLRAYKQNWDTSVNRATDINVGYGPIHQISDHGQDFKDWDFGKAHYNKISKQEAVDLLNLKITSGRGRNAVEVSINDPVPDNLAVSCPDDTAKRNINKLRFLLPGSDSSLALTEYEYREDRNQFFPIYKQPFSYFAFEKNGIEPFNKPRMDYAPQGYGLKGIYYAIKLSDVIYETDQYEHPLTVNSDLLLGSQYILDDCLTSYFVMKALAPIFKKAFSKAENLEIKNDKLKYILNHDFNLNLDSPAEDFISVFNSNDFLNLDRYYLKTKERALSWLSDLHFDKQYEREFKQKIIPLAREEIENVFRTKDNLYELANKISIAYLDSIEDERVKNIWKRRKASSGNAPIRKSIASNTENGNGNGENFTPYDTYAQSNEKGAFPKNIFNQTGDHKKYDALRSADPSLPDQLYHIFTEYKNLFGDKKERKIRYINSLNALNKLKKQKDYYEDEEEYNELLADVQARFDDAKQIYLKETLWKIKDLQLKLLNGLDQTYVKARQRVEVYLSTLQKEYAKILKLRDLSKDISSYSEKDFVDLYGSAQNKELIEKLEKKIEEQIKLREQILENIRKRQQRIEELRRQLEMEQEELNKANANIDEVDSTINQLTSEKDSIPSGIDDAIKQAYAEQRELDNETEDLINKVKEFKIRKKKAPQNQNLKVLDNRVRDLVTFFNELKQDNPDEEDILSDDEDEE